MTTVRISDDALARACGADDVAAAFERAGATRAIGPAAAVEELVQSGLRGRGGAGFPAGIKWRTVAEAPGARKYVVCNADEGDSGTFADRMLMEGDPFQLIEGMAIAGHAVGASRGVIDRIRAGGRALQPLEAAPQMHNMPKAARTREDEIALLEDLCETMRDGSLCALGGFTPYPVLSALRHLPEDFA